MIKIVKLYYDSYEFKYGDGFFPLLYKDKSCDSEIDIIFELYNRELTQRSGPPIKGYDGNTYNEIVEHILALVYNK